MSGAFEVDDRELREYAVTLTAAAGAALDQIRPVMSRAALNIKRQQVAEMSASGSFHGIARSISYDITVDPSGITAEIGPDTARGGGPLANIAYFGSPSKPGGASVPDPLLAAEAEYPALERYLGDILEDLA